MALSMDEVAVRWQTRQGLLEMLGAGGSLQLQAYIRGLSGPPKASGATLAMIEHHVIEPTLSEQPGDVLLGGQTLALATGVADKLSSHMVSEEVCTCGKTSLGHSKIPMINATSASHIVWPIVWFAHMPDSILP